MKGGYRTVVIDFPWPLKLGGNIPSKMQGTTLKETLPYQTQTVADIRAFPIDDYAAEDCLLFIWVINGKANTGQPIIQIAFEMLEHWRFKYHTLLTWVKNNPYSFWSPIKWATEHVIFAYRGKFRELTSNQYAVMSGVFYASNKTHSEKPAKFYQELRKWTDPPRIDLFARNAHPGFDGEGDEYVHDGPLSPFLEETPTEECTE